MIGRHQWEAARAIGMGRFKSFRLVILPQAIARILGPLGNQFIILVKDTSLVSAIGVCRAHDDREDGDRTQRGVGRDICRSGGTLSCSDDIRRRDIAAH